MVKSRRRARETALQALYEIEASGCKPEEAVQRGIESADLGDDLRAFAQNLARGVLEHREQIDQGLAPLIKDYSWERVAAVDRNIMRIAAYELLFLPHMPPAVSINEAIEIAKKYSTAESGRFVNGVLAKFLEGTEKASWNPDDHPADISEEPAEPEAEPPVETVQEGPEADELLKVGAWKIRKRNEKE